jgi:ATP-dependent DNA helicase RecG
MKSTENITTDYKSLRKIVNDGKYNTEGLRDLAITCVCLANTQGGEIIIGIEDKDRLAPKDQVILDEVINTTLTRLRTMCFNVGLSAGKIHKQIDGGEYFTILVHPSLKSIATTSEGKIYIRVGDQCQAGRSEDIHRLANEKDAFQWELQLKSISLQDIPETNIQWFANQIRNSKRVKQQIKELSNIEIAEHYNLIDKNQLTNLGVLWIGSSAHRTRLAYPLTVQYIVYDELENKVRKLDWHDNSQNPKELLLDIEKQAIELTYYDEFPQGLFRKQIRHYDERVIRELLINAFAHKSYTISGDIFINVYTDRLEISNPGGLPLGITKENILHSTSRRNPHLIRVLHDLELMEGEGTGYNLIYEINSRDAKAYPIPVSDFNSTTVIQTSKILDEESVLLLDFISKNYQLSQKEFIVLGIVARHKKILATQFAKELQLTDEDRLRSYVSKLLAQNILVSRGIKKGTDYLINPKLIVNSKINIKPTLKIIEAPRLKALIEETLKIYPNITMNELQQKLGDAPLSDVRKCIYKMVKDEILHVEGGKKNRTYKVAKKK